ncbi:MAG: hypothetical protein ABL940_00640 [Bacteroidia bacterium]
MKNKRNNTTKILSKIISYFGIGSLLFLVIGLKDIDNYLDWLTFSTLLVFTGLLFGMAIYFVLNYFIPNVKTYKNSKGIGLFFSLPFVFMLIFFGLGSIVNESLIQKKECKEYIIQNIGESGSKQKNYYVFINNGKKTERLSFGKAFNNKYKIGDNISLCIITGRLGFKYYKIQSEK